MLDISKINSQISTIIEELLQKGRIDNEYKKKFYSSYDQPTLQIGVVGKMKTGKSALMNSIIFGDDVLPSSPEPFTVTLTKISYGKKETSTVEFISEDDLIAIKKSASYSGQDKNLLLQKESAEEILEHLPSNYAQLLGQTQQNIPNEELGKYVAAGGEYCGLVKSVIMEIKNDNLKGITIIDTPGFNDPVVTRGETTTDFLDKCHVILFVHNSDGYDETDGALLNEQIEKAGISKLVDVFNKMDTRKSLPLDGWKQQLEIYLEDREEYLSKDKYPVAYSLIKNSDAVAVSAFMALCGQRSKESRSEFVKNQIAKFEERYPELTEDESLSLEDALFKYSNIGNIITILNRIASNGKQYLIDKPLNTLVGKLKTTIEQIKSEIDTAESKLKLLNQDRASALSDLEGLKDFMKSIKESVKRSPMEILLLKEVAKTRTDIYNLREEEKKSITKEIYPEPSLLGTGVTKANIGAYNVFLDHFQGLLRVNYDSLSGQITSTANNYIRDMVLSLVNPKISEERRENFEKRSKNEVASKIQDVYTLIPEYSITALPSGRAEQWSLLYTDFGKHYDDDTLNDYLTKYTEVSEDIGDPEFIINILSEMEEDLTTNLNKTPSEIQNSITEIKENIKHLKEELDWTKDQLTNLNNIK